MAKKRTKTASSKRSVKKRKLERTLNEFGARPFVWPEDLVAFLGKIPDLEIARKLGITSGAVAAERRRRGIPTCRPQAARVIWTKEMIALLGTASDRVIAKRFGISEKSVYYRRAVLNIPAFGPQAKRSPNRVSWRRQHLKKLGKVPDAKLAEEMGISAGTVAMKRRKLKIPSFKPIPVVRWTKKLEADLGKISDEEFARRHGMAVGTISLRRRKLGIPACPPNRPMGLRPDLIPILHLPTREACRKSGLSASTIWKLRRKWGIEVIKPASPFTPEVEARLGKESDNSIARELGILAETVAARRRALGIAPWSASRQWTEDEIALLGTISDSAIARRLDCSWKVVKNKREELGIEKGVSAQIKRRRQRYRPEIIARMGKEPDADIARELGVTPIVVARQRRARGIAAPPSKPSWKLEDLFEQGLDPESEIAQRMRELAETGEEPAKKAAAKRSSRSRRKQRTPLLKRKLGSHGFEWTEELAALLGKIPDPHLAEVLGVSRIAVYKERVRRGIPASKAHRKRGEWTREMIARLGKASDAQVAKELGVSAASVTYRRKELEIPAAGRPPKVRRDRRRWTPEELARLGEQTDQELARNLGVSATTVAKKRRHLGIPAKRAGVRVWSEEMLSLLGKMTDAQFGQRFGMSRSAVQQKRRQLGIPSSRRRR